MRFLLNMYRGKLLVNGFVLLNMSWAPKN